MDRIDPRRLEEQLVGVGSELAERRRVEEALRRSEQKLSFHIQQTPLGVIEWDIDYKIVEWNASATRIFGYSREEALGRSPLGMVITEERRRRVEPSWREQVARGGAQRIRGENITKDGRTIICEWYNTKLVDDAGQAIGLMSLVDDVTEQEELARELRERERAQAATIARLSTPVIEVWEGILTLPIIGAIDDERAGRMTEELLTAIVRTRAAFTIVDLTGMDGVDATNAEHLLRMVRSTGLLGSRCLVSGISPSAAQAMIGLGLALTDLTTFGTLRDALSFALANARPTPRGVRG